MSLPFLRVIDSSALLALLHREPGADIVALLLSGAAMSAVNWSEVLQKAYSRDLEVAGMKEDLAALNVEIIAFDADQADSAAGVWASTRKQGLSLGDSACIALALRAGVPAITADRAWGDLELGVQIQVIR